MPKRTMTQSVTLLRGNERVTLEAGKTHDLSTEEISDILAVSPGALSTTATVDLSDSDVTDVEDKKDPDAALTPAEKKAVKEAAAKAQKAATGTATTDL